MLVAGGVTDVTTYFALRLTADGTAATGLTIINFDLQYVRSGVAPVAKVDATALAATDNAHGDNQAIEIDATDQPGLYRVDWPDAAFVAGVSEVVLTVKVATAFTEHLRVTIDGEVNVVEWAGVDVVAGAIPAFAADAGGGLIVSDTGGLDADAQAASVTAIEVDTAELGSAVGASISADIADVPNTIWDEAMTEISSVPAVTASFRDAIKWLFALSRNKGTQTSTVKTLRNDVDGADIGTSIVSDDGTTFTREEWS